jgi:serine/threonine protein kinase
MVFECSKKKGGDTTKYAVKMLEHQSTWWGKVSKSQNVQWEMFQQEYDMLRRMEHKNVVRMVDVFADNHFLYFVMDKYENSLIGAILPLLQQGKKVVPNMVLGEISHQMCASIKYLHDQKIVHRDVKADNYLVDMNKFKGMKFTVVLTDLSTARVLEDGVFLKEMLGTMQYWAPEVVARYYNHKVDCWAIGVILWCMLTMKFPFNTVQETYTKKLTKRPDKMNDEQFDLVTNLLEKNPAKRLSAEAAMNHEFVKVSHNKHLQSCTNGDVEDVGGVATGVEAKGEDEGLGFGQSKKALDPETLRRRADALTDAQDRFNRGEKNCVSMEEQLAKAKNAPQNDSSDADVVAKDKQRQGEAKTYSWWSVERCQELKVPDVETDCKSAGQINEDDPAQEGPGDIALTEPSTVKDLREELLAFKVDVSKFGKGDAKTLEQLFHEIESMECRLMLRANKVIRVVDLMALRVRTPTAKILVEQSQKFPDGRDRTCNRLPAVMRQAGASGLATAKSEIERLLKNELSTTPDVIQVNLRLDDPSQESNSKKQDSQSYPGLDSVYRKTFFEASVNGKADPSKLKKLGLVGSDEASFKTTQQDGSVSTWQWYNVDEIKKNEVDVSAPKKMLSDFENYAPISVAAWTEDQMKNQLTKHKIDMKKFGTGKARSIRELAEETSTGETRFYSNGTQMRRYLEILVVKIKNSYGGYLIETGHSFGKGQSSSKNQFPATKVRPYEDKVWAVRRLLGEVDIPYSSSKIQFGPRRVETQESPSYPGITTVYLKQVVEVSLNEIDLNNLNNADVTAKWFAHGKKEAS